MSNLLGHYSLILGFLKDRNFLTAVKILAKHYENYMPPEVKEAIKESN